MIEDQKSKTASEVKLETKNCQIFSLSLHRGRLVFLHYYFRKLTILNCLKVYTFPYFCTTGNFKKFFHT